MRTRLTLLAILGAAEQNGVRGAVLREAFDAMFARGRSCRPETTFWTRISDYGVLANKVRWFAIVLAEIGEAAFSQLFRM